MNRISRLAPSVINLKSLAAALAAALLCAQVVAQQGRTAARPDRGLNPGGAYAVSDIESISLQSGNVNLSIPLASLPPIAGGKLSLTVSAHYNSKLWNVVRAEKEGTSSNLNLKYVQDQPQLSDAGGWSITGRYVLDKREARDDFSYLFPSSPDPGDGNAVAEYNRLTQHNWYKVFVRTPDGAEHELRPSSGNYLTYGGLDHPRSYLWGFHTAVPEVIGAPVRYDSTDGTYLSAVWNPPGHASGVRWTLFLPDGTQVIDYADGVQRIRDVNGNSIRIFSDGDGTHYQDEQNTEREIRVKYDPTGAGGYGQTRISYKTVGGVGWQYIDLNHGATTVRGKIFKVNDWNPNVYGENGQLGIPCERYAEMLPTEVSVVREIVFPATEPNSAGRRFSFSYNSDETETATTEEAYFQCGVSSTQTYTRTASRGMGALSRMVTPTGAEVRYVYQLSSTHDFLGGAFPEPDQMARETLTDKYLRHDGVPDPEHWEYSIPHEGVASTSSVKNPDGSESAIWYYPTLPEYARGYGSGEELGGLVFMSSDGRTVTHKRWETRGVALATGTNGFTAFNPYVAAEYTTLLEGSAAVRMSAKKYEYDHNGNVTKVTEYDWFDPAQVERYADQVPQGAPVGAKVLRVTDTSYHNQADGVTSPGYYRQRMLATFTPSLLGAVKETATGASRTRFSYDGQQFGDAPTNGNVTQVSRLDDKGDADAGNDMWVTTSATYGAYGNPSTTTDANGNVTTFHYEDDTHALPTKVEVNPLNGTGVQTTLTAYDKWTGLVTSATDPNGQVSTIDYTNQLLSVVDPFGRPGMSRTPAGTTPNGETLYSKVYTFYEDAARRVRMQSDLNSEGDGLLKSRTTHDQLKRVVLVEQSENGSTYTISSQTVYAEAGRITLQSSPARGSSPESWTRITKDIHGRVVEAAAFGGSTQPSSTTPANQLANWTGSVTTLYAANETTVTDQSGKKRRSVSDALGRLVRVDEPDQASGALDDSSGNPVQPTFYVYDALGNLRKVDQGGQLRYFMYDSLERLIRTKSPEQGSFTPDTGSNPDFPALTDSGSGTSNDQWSTGYRYDGNGNLLKRKDARGVVTTYAYDGLNRNTTVTYTTEGSGAVATPNVVRSYDGATQGKGRLHSVAQSGSNTSATYIDQYDAVGRPLVQRQKFAANGADYTVSRTYDLAGNVKSQTYPSGRTVAYTYDNAGRLSAFAGDLGGGTARTYADAFAYDASGRISQERFGTDTAVYNKRLYNSRGQLAEIRVGTAALPDTGWQRGAIINHYSGSGSGSDNNGNLRRQEVFIPKIDGAGYDQGVNFELISQNFDYDALNRLQSVSEGDRWKQTYNYDRWGNRTISAQETQIYEPNATYSIPEPQFAVNQGTNRLGVPTGQSGQMDYDAAGNLTVDTYQGGQGGGGTRAYDAENRMTSAQFVAGQAQTTAYIYDGDGRRVRRLVGTASEVWQVYGMGGELLAEYAPNAQPDSPRKEYGYRGGELLVTAEPVAGPPPQQMTQRMNVALASNGGVASASSSFNAPPWVFTPAGANDGDRKGLNWGSGGGWNDSTGGAFPDWLQVEFDGAKTIDEVNVFTNQDNYANPSEPTETMTFTQYGLTDFEVQYWADSQWVTVQGGSVSSSNKVWRKVTFPAVTTTRVRVLTSASIDGYSRLAEVEAWGVPARVNHALASNGGVATASSSYNSPPFIFTPAGANDGDRKGMNWGSGGGWNDNAPGNSFPDWLQIDFAGPRSIDEIDVFTGQDNWANPSEPTEALTFSQYGLTAYEVQCWDGSGWVTVAGGSVTGNDRVWRRFSFATVVTTKVRVLTQGSVDGYSRVTEVEAWGGGGAAAQGAEVRWLVADQLGTPRMVMDESGMWAGISRHDYLPFGEELSAGTGGRQIGQGYAADNVRQQFTGYERDDETNLDYAQARYYTGPQGRFASVDPLQSSANPGQPQSWNRYTYTLNNPLKFTDPTGLVSCPPGETCINENTSDEHYFDSELGDYVYSGSGMTPEGSLLPVAGLAGPIAPVAVQTATTLTCATALPLVAAGGATINLYLLGQRLTIETIPYSPYGMTLPDGTRSISCTAGNQALQQLQRVDSPVFSILQQGNELKGDLTVVRGGQSPDFTEVPISGAFGVNLYDASMGVPHGKVWHTTVRAINASGGKVIYWPEPAYPGGPMNYRHVNIFLGAGNPFTGPVDNPVPKALRIPGRP